jgi:gluconolactonase
VTRDGQVEIVASVVDGLELRAPDDLAFGPDGRLYFTDPGGTYDPVARPDRGRVFALGPGGAGELVAEFDAVYPNGIVVAADGAVIWVESYTGSVQRRDAHGTVHELAVLPADHAPDGLAIADDGCL